MILLRTSFSSFSRAVALATFALTFFGGVDARAANVAWNGTGTNGNWSTTGNFAGAIAADTLQFGGTNNLINTNDFAVGTAASTNVAFTFLAGAGAFQLFGNQQFLSSGVTVSSTNTQTINLNIGFTANNTFNMASGNLIMNGSLSGAFSLTKSGAFDLFLNSATNSYGGATIVSGGRLVAGTLANAGTVSSIGTNASITLQTGGDLEYTGSTVSIDRSISLASGDGAVGVSNATTALTISGVVSGAGNLQKLGAGTLILSGANTYTGATTISNGTLAFSGSGRLSTNTINLVNSGAVLDLSGASATSFTNASLTGVAGSSLLFSNKNLTLGTANTSTTFSGTLSGNASSTLTKVGTGTLTLAGDNNFSGGILISAGGLAGTTANLGGMPLTNNGTLIFDQSTNGTYSSVLAGTGALGKLGSGTVTLGNANTYGGTTTIGGGAFIAGTLADAGTTSSIGTNAALIITNGGVLAYTGSTVSINRGISLASGVGGLSVSSASSALTVSGVISNTGSLLKDGAGTLILSGANTYTGGTTITNGTLALSGSGTLAATGAINLAASGAVFDISGITAAGFANATSLSGAVGSSIVLGAKNLSLTNTGVVTLASAISGSGGSLTKAGLGTLVLSGSNSYTGATTVSAGLLEAQNSASLGTGDAGTTVTSGATLALSGNITNTTEAVTVGGTGVGTLGALRNLSGDNTVSGGTTLSAATTIASDAGTLTLGNVNAANFLPTFLGAGNAVVSGSITNSSAGLTKNGSGTLTLAGSNSYAGVTDVLLGTLRVENANALGTTAGNTLVDSVATGAALYLAGNVTLNESLSLRGTGIAGEGALYNVQGTNTWNGAIVLANTATIGAATNSQLIISGRLTNGTRILTMGADGNITLNGGLVSSGGDLIKAGTGSLVLAGSNTFGGNALLVGNGVVSLQSSNSLAGSAANVISNGATMDLTGGIDVAAAAVTINGTGFNSTGAIRNSSGTNIYRGAVTLGSASTIVSQSGSLTLASTLGGNFEKTFDGAGNTTASGIVSGTGVGVTKTGAGTLTFGAANTFTGVLGVQNGTLSIATINNSGANGTLGNSANAVVLGASGATGELLYTGATASSTKTFSLAAGGSGAFNVSSNAAALTLSAAITNTGALVKRGAGTLILTGVNTYSGGTTVNEGTLAIGTTADRLLDTGALTVNGSTAVFSIGTLNEVVGAVTLTDGSITGTSGVLTGTSYTVENGTVSAILGGSSVALTKNNAGTVTLSGANTYTGATSINGGTLAFGSTLALTNSSGINLGNGTFLQYTGATAALNRNISVTNGTGTIRNTGAGTLTLSGNLVKNGTTLRFNGGTNVVTGVISGASANSDLVVDAATVTLNNTNTYNGPTFIRNGGTLTANVVGAMPTNTRSALIMDDNGTGNSIFNVTASQQIASLTGAASSSATIATNTSLTIGTTSGNTTFAGVISGGGGLVKDGASTQTLTGANSYSGGTLVSAGVLAGSASGLQGNITNNATVAFTQAATGTYSGTMSGTGALTKDGTGLLTLTSSNSFSGGTTVREGELHVNSAGGLGTGSVSLAGTNPVSLAALHYSNTVSPLTIGALTLNGNAEIALQALASMSSTGAVTINSTNNFVSLGGSNWNLGTNILVSGTSLTINGGASILLTGPTVNNGTLGLGSTTNIGRTSYTFGSNSTSFYLTTAGLNFDVLWSGAQNNLWNTNATNWQVATNGLNPSGTNIAFATDDNVYFGNTATNAAITVDAGGIQAGEMYVTNSAGTVTFNGGNLAAHNLFKSGGGDLTISTGLQLIGDDAAGPNSGVFTNSGSGNVTLAGAFTEGSLVQSGAGTVTLSASNSFGGATVVNAGVLNLNSATGSALGSTASVSVSTGATLLLTQNNQVNNSATVSLSGGTIRTASGVSETFGNLTVTGSGFLDFGTTSYANQNTINFGTYTPSALLTIDNFNFGSTLTFKSDLSSTINNLSYFSFSNGGIASSSWNAGTSTFTITAIPEPSTYLAAAGLLGLMLWPSRKRLLRDAKKILGLRAPMRDRLAARRAIS